MSRTATFHTRLIGPEDERIDDLKAYFFWIVDSSPRVLRVCSTSRLSIAFLHVNPISEFVDPRLTGSKDSVNFDDGKMG